MRMGKPWLAVALLAGVACTPLRGAPRHPFQQQLDRHIAAIHARDIAAIEATITSGRDLLLILPSGTTTLTREEYLGFHRRLFAAPAWRMTFVPVRVHEQGGYAHALYRVTFDPDGSGPAPAQPALLSLGFALEGTEWRLVHDQNTPATPPP